MQPAAEAKTEQSPSRPRPDRWIDALIVLVFAGMGLLVQVGILQAGPYPYIPLSGDGANLASYAAAWDNPDGFMGDEILGDLGNIQFYSTIHIPLTRLLAGLTGSYSAAFVLPLGVHAFLQLLGFYLLGRVLFHSRYWALLLSIITFVYVGMNLGEFWGFYPEPLPRFTFQAVLPFILAAALAWKDKPGRWAWIMAAAGLLMYVHPVSAPVWAMSIWLGLWVCRPAGWSFGRSVLNLFLVGMVFVVVSIPFVLNYTGARGGEGADYGTVYAIMAGTLPPGMMDLSIGFRDFALSMIRGVLPVLGVAGAVVVFRLRRHDRASLYIVLLWAAGLLIGSVLIPILDHAISRAMGRIPFQVDLVRGLRYLIPLSLLFCLWALYEAARTAVELRARRLFAGLAVVVVAFWCVTHYQQIYLARDGLRCLLQFRLLCTAPTDESQLMDALKSQTPPGSQIMVSSGDREWLAVRYYATRPLVYTWRDGGGLFYANEIELVRWLTRRDQLDAVNLEQDRAIRLDQLIALAREWNADYLVTDFAIDWSLSSNQNAAILYSNPKGSLVAVQE